MDAQWTISDDLFFTVLSAMFSREKVPAAVFVGSFRLTLSHFISSSLCGD